MLEKVYKVSIQDTKIVEKLVDDDNAAINHMVLTKGTGLPEHYSNSNVYMIIVRGTMTIQLEDNEPQRYTMGNIVNIPYNVKMNVKNFDEKVLEFFVVKAPNPKYYGGK